MWLIWTIFFITGQVDSQCIGTSQIKNFLQQGVLQGDIISLFIFITAVKIQLIKITKSKNIEGIKKGEFKPLLTKLQSWSKEMKSNSKLVLDTVKVLRFKHEWTRFESRQFLECWNFFYWKREIGYNSKIILFPTCFAPT